jgi:hypothetical protein
MARLRRAHRTIELATANSIDPDEQSWINLFADDSRSDGRYEKRPNKKY